MCPKCVDLNVRKYYIQHCAWAGLKPPFVSSLPPRYHFAPMQKTTISLQRYGMPNQLRASLFLLEKVFLLCTPLVSKLCDTMFIGVLCGRLVLCSNFRHFCSCGTRSVWWCATYLCILAVGGSPTGGAPLIYAFWPLNCSMALC
jgi:hypothetical protein